MIKFEDALYQFMHAVEAAYGVSDGITKIALSPELFDRVMMELMSKPGGIISGRPSDWSEPTIYGIKLVARRRDLF